MVNIFLLKNSASSSVLSVEIVFVFGAFIRQF